VSLGWPWVRSARDSPHPTPHSLPTASCLLPYVPCPTPTTAAITQQSAVLDVEAWGGQASSAPTVGPPPPTRVPCTRPRLTATPTTWPRHPAYGLRRCTQNWQSQDHGERVDRGGLADHVVVDYGLLTLTLHLAHILVVRTRDTMDPSREGQVWHVNWRVVTSELVSPPPLPSPRA
jgi:hypothetical protein